MSTQILYHGFGIRGYRHVRMMNQGGRLVFRIEQPRELIRCPDCGSQRIHCHGGETRRWKCPPIGGKRVFVEMSVPRVECLDCQARRLLPVAFAEPRRTYTRAFERYVWDLSQRMTIRDIAVHLGVGWDLIKDIQKRYLHRKYSKPRLCGLKRIAIDEISNSKGHKYLTIVLDLDSARVVFVGKGKKEESLRPFWKRLRASHAKIAAVAIDMSPAYQLAVKTYLPNAAVVFDRFHIMKLFNDKLSELRRALAREAQHGLGKNVLKGTRWLLLKNPENLDNSKNERERLAEALELNESLFTAYYLKDDLREVWEQDDQDAAQTFLLDWIARAEASGIRMLMGFAKTLRIHALGILAWYDHEISTGPLEGTNNKIKTLKRQAYGFRDLEFFKLKIYALHKTRLQLVG